MLVRLYVQAYHVHASNSNHKSFNNDSKLKKNKLEKKSLDQLTLIENEVRKMYCQIEDVLNYVNLPPLKLQNHSLHDILKKVIENIQTDDDIEIQLPKTNPQIICNTDKLEIVFVNLITNAVKAVNGEGSISVNAKTAPNGVIIEIEDCGPGIAEDTERCLSRYSRQSKPGQDLPIRLQKHHKKASSQSKTIEQHLQ